MCDLNLLQRIHCSAQQRHRSIHSHAVELAITRVRSGQRTYPLRALGLAHKSNHGHRAQNARTSADHSSDFIATIPLTDTHTHIQNRSRETMRNVNSNPHRPVGHPQHHHHRKTPTTIVLARIDTHSSRVRLSHSPSHQHH